MDHSAVDVGDKSVSVKKNKVQRGFSRGDHQKGANELMLRADEVGTQGATLSTLNSIGGDRRWLTQTDTLSAKQSTKE